MNYAIIKTGGKQYRVQEGDIIEVESLGETKENANHSFAEVLLVAEEGKVKIGNPFVANTTISATILGNTKGEKIRVVRFKAKSRYRKVKGHRQALTRVQIGKINGAKKSEPVKTTNTKQDKPMRTRSTSKTSSVKAK